MRARILELVLPIILLPMGAGCAMVSDVSHQERIDQDADGDISSQYPGGADCDDFNAEVNSQAPEVCNGIDDNCDGVVDDVDGPVEWLEDKDGDGYGDASLGNACVAPANAVEQGGDCNDDDPTISPDAEEACNGVDDDCDGTPDDGLEGSKPWYADADGDGYGIPTDVVIACLGPEGYTSNPDDCDDDEPSINPSAAETCNGIDDDCKNGADDGLDNLEVWYADADADGFGNAQQATLACVAPPNHVDGFGDCDDTDSTVYPGADETCGPADQDCDGDPTKDAVDSSTWFLDSDGDGYGNDAVTLASCDPAPDYVADSTDCDDSSPEVYPGADEYCDGRDEDCDGTADNDPLDPTTFYADGDLDGYGDLSEPIAACTRPSGHVLNSTDCDDTLGTSHPNAEELCNGADDDCDGAIDEVQPTWYADADNDGWGNANITQSGCTQPAGHVGRAQDCNDNAANVNPSEDERCNGFDDNCDGSTDGDDAVDRSQWYKDADADGYGDPDLTRLSCARPNGFVDSSTDCNDAEPLAWSGAGETCSDGVDNDCDGLALGCTFPPDLNDADGIDVASQQEAVQEGFFLLGPGDISGDGRSDLAVSGPELEVNGDAVGGVHIYQGVDLTAGVVQPWATVYGEEKDSLAGYTLAAAGDLDADGLADLWVGAPYSSFNEADHGAVYLLTGAMAAAGESLSAAPTRILGVDQKEWLGWAMASAQLTGTAAVDLAVGSPGTEPEGEPKQGVVRIFAGPIATGDLLATGATTVINGREKESESGSSLAVGDLDGDGTPDLALGSPMDAFGGGDSVGGASIYLGPLVSGEIGPSEADVVLRGSSKDSRLGATLASGGDLDGDGIHDLVVGAPDWKVNASDKAGRVLIIRGGVLPTLIGTSAAWVTLDGTSTDDKLGAAVSIPGDVDRSGVADLWLGAPGYQDRGAAALFLDLSGGVYTIDDAQSLAIGGRMLGSAVAGAGDLNGDGTLDLAAGDPDALAGAAAFQVFWGVGL